MEKIQAKLVRKYIGVTSLGLSAILYIISGIAFIFWKSEIPLIVRFIVIGYAIILGVSGILTCLSKFTIPRLLHALMPIGFAVVFVLFMHQMSSLYAFLLGIYILVVGVIKVIDYIILRANRTPGRIMVLISAIIILILSYPLVFNAEGSVTMAFFHTGVFCVFYGFTLLGDFFVEVSPIKQTNRFKKRMRINLPVFLTMLMPKKAIGYINQLLSVDDDGVIEEQSFKVDQVPDVEIFVHVTEKGFGTIGHADLYFEGKVYCYGNYDDDSFKLFGSVGDGVLFTVTNRDEYINFCAKATGDSIFAFGLRLNEAQKEAIRERLASLFTHVYPWECKLQRYEEKTYSSEQKPDDYASRLYEATHAKLYKFRDTSFKAYFVLTTNCVKLSDYVIRSTGIAAANPNGIMSPGEYYEYFDRQYHLKNSIVISKQTYHHDAKIEHE